MSCELNFASKFIKIPEAKNRISFAQFAASTGKEQRNAAHASRAVMMHPYRLPQFKTKTVWGRKTSSGVLGSQFKAEMFWE